MNDRVEKLHQTQKVLQSRVKEEFVKYLERKRLEVMIKDIENDIDMVARHFKKIDLSTENNDQ